MADAVIEIISDSGSHIIKSNRYNPSLLAKGTVATVADSPRQYESVSSRADIIFSGDAAMEFFLAFRPAADAYSSSTALMGFSYNSGAGQWAARLVSEAPAGTNIDWWLFGRPTTAPAAGPTIEIRDDSGALVYSLSQKPLRVAAAMRYPDTLVQFNGASGRIYAALFGGYIGGWRWVDGGRNPTSGQPEIGWYTLQGFAKGAVAIANGLDFADMVHSSGASSTDTTQNPPYDGDQLYPGTVLVADVTGY